MQASSGGTASGGAAASSFKCAECGRTFGARVDLEQHLTAHTEKERDAREESGKESPSASLRRRRSRTNAEGDPLQCQVCGLKCRWASELIIHNRFHTGEKPYECKMCKKKFSDKSNLTVHNRRRHTRDKPI